MNPDLQAAIQRLHDTPAMAALVVAGAGVEAVRWLLGVAGASRTVLEAVVPYGERAMVNYLGWEVMQAVNAGMAESLAAAAYARARRFRVGEGSPTLGVGCTATIATDRPKRGEHRAHVAVWDGERVATRSLVLQKGLRDRVGEERVVSALIVAALCEAAGLPAPAVPLADGEHIEQTESRVDRQLERLLADEVGKLTFYGPGVFAADEPIRAALLPGSFNPLHHAHVHLARIAEARLGRPVLYELSVKNVDKPTLTVEEIRERLEQFAWDKRRVALTCAPLYRHKARLFPGCTFIIGYDTAVRLIDPKYYGGDPAEMLAALAEVREAGCDFFIAGREVGGRFRTVADLDIPPGFEGMFSGLSEDDFRVDISSTELRARGFHVDYE